MKKIYLTLSAIALTTCALVAQNNKMAASHATANLSVANVAANKVIKNNSTQAAGDTVWVFDGGISYNWDGNLPASYSVALEDVDNLTITPGYTATFGAKGSYKFFYYVDPTAVTLHYGHAD